MLTWSPATDRLARLHRVPRPSSVTLLLLHGADSSNNVTLDGRAGAADPDIVYVESLIITQCLEDETQLRLYRWLWDTLVGQSVPLEEFLG